MNISEIDEQSVDRLLNNAEQLMKEGRWTQAESIIRECCTHPADLNLRLIQLEVRKECAEYALGLDWDELGREGVYYELEEKFEAYSAEWVINQYMLTPKGFDYGNDKKAQR